MQIETIRFGTVDAEESDVIRFNAGIIGFPREKQFILIPHGNSSIIAWLQSVQTPELAFPVVSAHGLVSDYPDVSVTDIAEKYDLGSKKEDLAILVVLSAPRNQPATVNLLAPLLISSESRRGAQVFLEGSRFSTRELFVVPAPETKPDDEENASDPERRVAV